MAVVAVCSVRVAHHSLPTHNTQTTTTHTPPPTPPPSTQVILPAGQASSTATGSSTMPVREGSGYGTTAGPTALMREAPPSATSGSGVSNSGVSNSGHGVSGTASSWNDSTGQSNSSSDTGANGRAPSSLGEDLSPAQLAGSIRGRLVTLPRAGHGHAGAVTCIAMTEGGGRVVTGSDDHTGEYEGGGVRCGSGEWGVCAYVCVYLIERAQRQCQSRCQSSNKTSSAGSSVTATLRHTHHPSLSISQCACGTGSARPTPWCCPATCAGSRACRSL